MAAWPPSLPSVPQKGYTEERGVNLVITPMDAGPAKVRKRSNKPTILNMSFIMTDADLVTLESFITTTIAYTSRFTFPHPRLKVSAGSNLAATVDCRFMPQSNGALYTLTYISPGYYTISVQFEVMP